MDIELYFNLGNWIFFFFFFLIFLGRRTACRCLCQICNHNGLDFKYITCFCVPGMFGMALLAMIPRTHRQFMHACNVYYNSLAEKGILSSVMGGLLLGIGMVFAGSVSN